MRNKACEEQNQSRKIQYAITDAIEAALSAPNNSENTNDDQQDGTKADSTGNKRAIVLAAEQLKRRRNGG